MKLPHGFTNASSISADTAEMKGSQGEAESAASVTIEGIGALAEREASRHFGDGPMALWQLPTRRVRVSRWTLGGPVCVVVALLGSGAWGLLHKRDAVPAPETHPVTRVAPVSPPSTLAEPALDATARQSNTAAALRVERTGGVWRIHAVAASRHEAVLELAELSGSEMPGGADALRLARPLDLQWEGRSLASAWRAVIGNEASYALQCRRDRCTAWIVDPDPALKPSAIAPHGDAVSMNVGAARLERGAPEPSAYD